MEIKNLKIRNQLALSLGAIYLAVAILGAMAWVDVDSLWQNTHGLYNHPLEVRRAVGDIKVDILAMHREMKDLPLANDEHARQQIIQSIDAHEADAYRKFEVLYKSYLGPKADIDDVYIAFVQWKAIRDNTIRMIESGKVEEAVKRTRPSGVGGAHVELMMGHINDISLFAKNKADEFYNEAEQNKNDNLLRLKIVLALIFLLCSGAGYLLLRGIRDPLDELSSVTQKYRQGDLSVRCGYDSSNEFGMLSNSFNELAETVQKEVQNRQNVSVISETMLKEEELEPFFQSLLKALMERTDSQIGGVYVLNDEKTDFEHVESIGMSNASRKSFSAIEREGEFGVALATGRIQWIKGIPEDTRLVFHSVSGDIKARDVLTIPIFSSGEAVAMISLSSVKGYDEADVKLVNDVWDVMTARLNGVLAFRRVQDFSEKLQAQNTELESQKQELSLQADELTHQNIELDMQKKQLDESNRLKTNFLSNISHELRTPLNSVIALSSVLNRRLSDSIPEEEHGYLEVIERNGRNLLDLINDLLDLSRIEAGHEEITLTSFSIWSVTHEVIEMISPLIGDRDITLVNLVGRNIPSITSDVYKFRHILQNLVGNAVKFSEHGKIEVSTSIGEDGVGISVSDTGIGISPDHLPYVFDEFRQADESCSRKFGGTGLGLAIARRYARLLGGDITVESVPGMGSNFTLTFPGTVLSTKNGGAIELFRENGEADLRMESNQDKTILLVEDSEPVIVQLTDILTEQGFNVRAARNGREALEQINYLTPDAVILDLMMPEVDGFEVLKSIRSNPGIAKTPVLILTAKHITKDELRFLEGNNVHQLIGKGDVSRQQLISAVRKMVFPAQINSLADSQKSSSHKMGAKPTVLVVEDNMDNLLTVQALLRENFNIIEATDGKAGLDRAMEFKPDVVLLDISLPSMDGFEVLAEIRKQECLCNVAVIALTARAMKGSREEIMAHGFDAYISKPIDGELLRRTIREIIYGA